MNFALVGFGKMGRAIDGLATGRGHRRVAIIDPVAREAAAPSVAGTGVLEGADVVFEFTEPGSAEANVAEALQAGVAVVCGSTGWTLSSRVERLLEQGPAGAVIAPNFSVGMNLFYRLIREASRLYGTPGLHQPYLIEKHHRAKRDAPSGTAIRLAEIVVENDRRIERIHEGNPVEPLPDGTLQVVSVRAGGATGTHTVGYEGQFDCVTLTHAARSREGFALGAVLAAEYVVGRSGLHDFDAVLEQLLDRADGREDETRSTTP